MGMPNLTHDEFDALVKAMGEWGALATEPDILLAYDGTLEEALTEDELTKGLRTVFMEVREPHLYTAKDGKIIIVLPPEGVVTYDMINSFYPHEGDDDAKADRWLYTIKPYIGASWQDTSFLFRDGEDYEDGGNKIAPFKSDDVSTH